jgi:hypothetical protein
MHTNIASLYDNVGQPQRATELRHRAGAVHVSSHHD